MKGDTSWSSQSDRGLGWMVLVSALAHGLVIGALLVMPHSFLHHPPALRSYTVDLVSPDKIGGTNLVRGTGGKPAAPPRAEAPKPPPKAEAEPAKPLEVAKLEEKAERVPPPKPPPEDEKGEKVALAKATVPPTPTPEATTAPTAEPTKVVVAAAPPTATRTVKVVAKAPPPTATEKPKAVAKAAPTATAKPKKVAHAAEEAKKSAAQEAKRAKPAEKKAEKAKKEEPAEKTASGKASKPSEERSAATEAASEAARDALIANAIKRVEEQTGRPSDRATGGGGTANNQSGGSGAGAGGGPLSVGPGEGAGGEQRSPEFVLYYDQMTKKIKDRWTWAGANRRLKSVVGFTVLPTGEIVNVRTIASSGDPSYDLSAERAVRGANPLPPPPADYARDFSQVEYTFEPEDAPK